MVLATSRRRDTQKTQHGIETVVRRIPHEPLIAVETLRKPSTGLKLTGGTTFSRMRRGRDTQKTQHGIETAVADPVDFVLESRHSENPARD